MENPAATIAWNMGAPNRQVGSLDGRSPRPGLRPRPRRRAATGIVIAMLSARAPHVLASRDPLRSALAPLRVKTSSGGREPVVGDVARGSPLSWRRSAECGASAPRVPAGGAPHAPSGIDATSRTPPAKAGTVTIAAASSLRDAVARAAAGYEAAHSGAVVRPVFGASNVLARQIVEGAPVDLFLAADPRSMDAVEKAGRLVAETRTDLLTNVLVVVVPEGSRLKISGPSDLERAEIRNVAICDDAVPIGHYARAWLAAKGVLGRLEGRIVRPDDARATLAMVEAGAVDLGIVYRTDAKAAKRARIAFEAPASETPGVVYPAALVAGGPNPAGGKDLLEFLLSPAGLDLFREAGFGIAPGRP